MALADSQNVLGFVHDYLRWPHCHNFRLNGRFQGIETGIVPSQDRGLVDRSPRSKLIEHGAASRDVEYSDCTGSVDLHLVRDSFLAFNTSVHAICWVKHEYVTLPEILVVSYRTEMSVLVACCHLVRIAVSEALFSLAQETEVCVEY